MIKKHISVPWLSRLNRSHERYVELAWSKFLGNALAVLGIYTLVFFSVPGTLWRLVWLASFCVVFPKMVGRYVLSWKGKIPRKVNVGFFVCYGCRRLKPDSHRSCREYGIVRAIVCEGCNPNFADVYDKIHELDRKVDKISADIQEAKNRSPSVT